MAHRIVGRVRQVPLSVPVNRGIPLPRGGLLGGRRICSPRGHNDGLYFLYLPYMAYSLTACVYCTIHQRSRHRTTDRHKSFGAHKNHGFTWTATNITESSSNESLESSMESGLIDCLSSDRCIGQSGRVARVTCGLDPDYRCHTPVLLKHDEHEAKMPDPKAPAGNAPLARGQDREQAPISKFSGVIQCGSRKL